MCFSEANKFLESYDRKILYLIFGRKITTNKSGILNRDLFRKYCKERPLEEHVAHMKYGTTWGTDIDIHAAASYLQLPIYVCTQRSQSLGITGIALLH